MPSEVMACADDTVTSAKTRLQNLVNAFTAGASTRRHFPPEILFMIFQFGFDTSDFGAMFSYNVASVCKYWHDVASSSPTFWSTVEVFIDSNPPLRAIKAYMTHSAFRELDITLSRKEPDRGPWGKNEADGYEAARIAAVIQLLNPHVRRWRSLSIKTIHLDSIRVALTNCCGVASELVELELCSSRNELLDSRAFRPLVAELETPRVQELTLGGEVISLATSWTVTG